MDGAPRDRLRERQAELRRSLAWLEGYRHEALARDDHRRVAWAEDLIVRIEGFLGRLEGRRLARTPPERGEQDWGPHQAEG